MRTKKNYTREIEPDYKYDSVLINKLINRSMRDGKKTIARKQVYQALQAAAKKTNKKPAELIKELVAKISPKVEVRTRRVGGASYQVPVPVKPKRATSLAIRWMVTEANKRSNVKYGSYANKLAAEMLDALKEEGGAIAKKNHAHRMAEANKAFAHFSW